MNARIGIIGLGKIGHLFGSSSGGDPLSHSAAYARIPGVTVALGVDPNPDTRHDFSCKFPAAFVCAQPEDVPPAFRADVVSICSPTHMHQSGVMAALAWQPRVILCEKPLAPSIAEAEAIVAACRVRDCTLVVNYSRRWTPMLQALLNLIEPGGRLGTVTGACLRYNGGLLHNGTHWIDLLTALFGPAASARRLEQAPPEAGDPAESVALYWPQGCTAYLLSVRETGCSIGEGEIWGTGGLVRYSESGQRVTFQAAGPSEWSGFSVFGAPETVCSQGLNGHIMRAVEEAVQLARFGGTPTCSGADGIMAMRIVEMARNL